MDFCGNLDLSTMETSLLRPQRPNVLIINREKTFVSVIHLTPSKHQPLGKTFPSRNVCFSLQLPSEAE